MKQLMGFVLFGVILLVSPTEGEASTTQCGVNGCVITVDWALDEDSDSSTHTCDYTQGGLFFPDSTGSGAGKCTLRRAIREAGARSDDSICPGCSPVVIRFTGLNGTNNDADDSQYDAVNDQWILPIDSSSSAADHFRLRGQGALDVVGNITINGLGYNNATIPMPRVFIETSRSLEIELSDVTVDGLGFIGGMGVVFKEPNGSFTNNTWGISPDGTAVYFQDIVNNADAMAGPIGVSNNLDGDGLLVADNIFAGASTKAIEINSGTTGVVIRDNFVGTRGDGTVPTVPDNLKCRGFANPFNPTLDPAEWFGGWGISAAGTGLLIEDNVIVGLQNIRSTNDTPPLALEVFGASHTLNNNVIGIDNDFEFEGVCGQGIKFSTSSDPLDPMSFGHQVTSNVIVASRNGFENTKGAILWSDTSLPPNLDGGNTVRGNLVLNGPEKYFEMGPMISSAARAFEPGEITSIVGTTVTGVSDQSNALGSPSPCPNCIIDFYLDDTDANEEALDYLGSTTALSDGSFVFELDDPLDAGFGIRTTSTSQANNVIPNTWAGTTSEMSSVVYLPVGSDLIFADDFD